jgi:hypothetical protein
LHYLTQSEHRISLFVAIVDILVDFDNVLPQMRREGLLNLASRVVNAIAERKMQFAPQCRVRLYGGWYDGDQLTHQAQDLVTEIGGSFPEVIPWTTKRSSGKCTAQMELACALEVDPGRPLFHTRRTREFTDQLHCDKGRVQRCGETDCSLRILVECFEQKKCANDRCRTTPGDVLKKQEQKLVDTMMTADLVHLAKLGRHDLAVVSSDDDLWPGIQTALLYGARVIQVHTRPGRDTPEDYARGLVQYKDTRL